MSDKEKIIIDFLKKCKENKDKVIPLLQQSNEILLNYIDKLNNHLQQKENIIKEVRESANRELKIAEENIKQSEKWLEVEEEQEHAKKDIHTGKVIKRCMEMFLEILDKGE